MSRFRIKPLALACCMLVAGTAGLSACSQSSDLGTTPATAGSSAPAQSASSAVANAAGQADIQNNPFYKPSTLPFQAPDFSKIKDSDYQPAMEEGMKQQLAEIEQIANNSAPPTFDNTIVA